MESRRWPWLLALIPLLLCAGVLGGLLRELRPETGDPELDHAPRVDLPRRDGPTEHVPITVSGTLRFPDGSPAADLPVVGWLDGVATRATSDIDGRYTLALPGEALVSPTDLISDPRGVRATYDGQVIDFEMGWICPLTVQVVDPDGQPLGDVDLRAQVVHPDYVGRWVMSSKGHPAEPIELDPLSCGLTHVDVQVAGWGVGRGTVDTREADLLVLTVEQGIEVWGTVTDDVGTPLEGASIRAYGLMGIETTADEDGAYSLLIPAGRPVELGARGVREGDGADTHTVRLRRDQSDLELNWVLDRVRQVEVRCAGLPDDSCSTVAPILCTRPALPIGDVCSGNPTKCACPVGDVAVRGGNQSVRVAAEDQVAWLDFRDFDGGISGVVLRDGLPAFCRWTVLRVPSGVDDVLHGGVAARQGGCDRDTGAFDVVALEPGRYVVEITTGQERYPQDDVWVDGDVVDLGVIELGGGAAIFGHVVNGTTGEPEPNVPVIANLDGRENLNPIGAGALSDDQGGFVIEGLEPGSYRVFLGNRPLEGQVVHVEAESEAGPIELWTGDADLLQEQGFSVASGDGGALLVSAVEPGGAAESAGLAEGDAVIGVVVLGLDVLQLAPNFAEDATGWVLDNYSGPGVSLVVQRDGAELEIPLE